jgi:amino acid permease
MLKLYLRGIGLMVGMIFGAGIFVLPYIFSRSGLFWGIFHFLVAFFVILILNFLYADVSYYTQGKHRFTGYTEIFLGKTAKHFAFTSTIVSYYGSLLVYGLLGGIFLSNFFPNSGFSPVNASILFFVVGAILAFFNLRKIADINFYLTIPLFGFVVYLVLICLPAIEPKNFLSNLHFGFNNNWFLPYGIWIFTLSGSAVIPEVRDIFSDIPIKNFKRVILISLIACAFFSLLFGLAVWGAGNNETTEDALSGIAKVLGEKVFLIGSFIGFVAVLTSFIALAADMRNIFRYDYKVPRSWAWLATVVPPVVLFFLGVTDFVTTLGFVGAIGLGIGGVFIVLMARNMRKMISGKGAENLIRLNGGECTKPSMIIETIVIVGVVAGALYEIWRLF